MMNNIPRGIEVLVKKAAVDAEFRRLLLARRSEAAGEIGLALAPAERVMLDSIPAAQLQAIIERTQVKPAERGIFLGKAAAAMLLALGAVAGMTDAQNVNRGDRPAEPPPMQNVAGITPLPIATSPASRPTTSSQPTSAKALSDKEFSDLLKQLDDSDYKVRAAAQQRLKDAGLAALPQIERALKKPDLSAEVRMQLEKAQQTAQATTRPVRPGPPIMVAGAMVAPVERD